MKKKTVLVVFGTRPEAVKLCPVVSALSASRSLTPLVCVTAQHREMLDQVLTTFGVTPDIDLNLMTPGQTLGHLTSRILAAMDDTVAVERPDLVLVQGDTTTTFATALAAFYHRVPVAHVEAGLRTGDLTSPFPEESNRVITTTLSTLHFAPTNAALQHLQRQGVDPGVAWVTGNTVIDALLSAVERIRSRPPIIPGVPHSILERGNRIVLITGHRRESFGTGFESICKAIGALASRFRDVSFVYPVHMNPNVSEPVHRLLGGLENVLLIEPLDYLPFIRLLDACTFVLTDSGGIQEEAPSLGKPVLVMRNTTERKEAIDAGAAALVGTSTDAIVHAASRLLTDQEALHRMAHVANPFGDGTASASIVRHIEAYFAGSK